MTKIYYKELLRYYCNHSSCTFYQEWKKSITLGHTASESSTDYHAVISSVKW